MSMEKAVTYYPTYLDAIARFRDEFNVKVFHGSSPEVLQRIINPGRQTVFWLDAHFMAASVSDAYRAMDERYGQCPLLQDLFTDEFWTAKTEPIEWQGKMLENFVRLPYTNAAVMRDGLVRQQWPTMQDLAVALPGYDIQRVNNFLLCRTN